MSSLSQAIAAIIGEAILAHRLTPRTKLGERELGEILGASRIVIRQALIRLAEEGLVTIERNRGAFVASPTPEETVELYEALILVEQGMVAQLCDGADPSAITTLTDRIERQRQATDAGDHARADRLGPEFHAELMGLSNNRVIMEIHAQLNRRSRLLHALYPRDYDRCRLCDDHEQLADLIARRRARQARQLIDRHYRAILRGFRIDPAARPAMALEQAFAIEWPKQLSPRDNTVRRKELEHVGG